jgi:polyhydroxyalkanoate synthesis regulator phasin
MPRDLDQVLADLAEVQDQLIALPDDAFGEKAELQTRQDALRAEAQELRESLGDHDIDYIRRRIAHLEAELERYLDTRPAASVGQQGGGRGGGGMDPQYYHEMVAKMDRYVGYDEMRAELDRLRGRLAELEPEAD